MRTTPRRRPLKVGFQLPEVERPVGWPELREMALVGEQAGFDSIWVGDHLLYRHEGKPSEGPWEAWSQLAAIAAITSKIELGPLVACTSFHNPAMLAKKAATIDEISGGRLILGLGAGWNEGDYAPFGFPFDHRISRFEEAFTIIRTLLRDGSIDFEGRYYSARDCELIPRGPRNGQIPLLIGSSGERMLSITAPWMDAWNAWYDTYGNVPIGIAPLTERVDAALAAAGRDPASVERTVAIHVRLPGAIGRSHGTENGRIAALEGPPDVIADGLAAFARAGIGHVQLVIDPITVGSLERLAAVLEILDRG